MAKLKVYTFPDLILTHKAKPIVHVDRSYFKMADDMLETMYDAPGCGLAANQVGILERILVTDVYYDLEDIEENIKNSQKNKKAPDSAEVVGNYLIWNKKPTILINPKIIYREGTSSTSEGCLSVPEYYDEVLRSEKIKVEYKTIDGLTKTLSADGFLAINIQHEIDHLDGKLFIDRLSPMKKEKIKKKLLKLKS